MCDEVIPANTGSHYQFETPEDASHGYVYVSGPIVRFGETADYKYSAIRTWLSGSAEQFSDAEMVNIGVERAYQGQTGSELWEQFSGDELTARYLAARSWWISCSFFQWTRHIATGTGCGGLARSESGIRRRRSVNSVKATGSAHHAKAQRALRSISWIWCRAISGRKKVRTDMQAAESGVRTDMQAAGRDVRTTADQELRVTGTTGVRPAFVLPQM